MLSGLGNAKNFSFDMESIQKNMIPQTPAVSVEAENVVLLEHLVVPTKELVDCQYENKTVCVDMVDMMLQVQHVVEFFTKTSMTTEVDSEMFVEYRDVFAYRQNHGFNVSWLVNRLIYVEHLRFSEPLVPELHGEGFQSRSPKITVIQKAFGTTGANLAVGFIGDDLLSGP